MGIWPRKETFKWSCCGAQGIFKERFLHISIAKGVIYLVPSPSTKCKKESSQFRDSAWSPAERAPLPPPGCSSRNNRISGEKGARNHSFKDEIAAIIQRSYSPGEYRHLPDEAPSTRQKKKRKREREAAINLLYWDWAPDSLGPFSCEMTRTRQLTR